MDFSATCFCFFLVIAYVRDVSAPALLPTAPHPAVTDGTGCFRRSAVGTNAVGTASACRCVLACWRFCGMDAVRVLFFMLIQRIAASAFCIQGLFAGGSELAWPWPAPSLPHAWENNGSKPKPWSQQGQPECVARGPGQAQR